MEHHPAGASQSSYIRFAVQHNEFRQSDFTHWRLANNTEVEILWWLDNYSRLVLLGTDQCRITGVIVGAEFAKTIDDEAIPYRAFGLSKGGSAVPRSRHERDPSMPWSDRHRHPSPLGRLVSLTKRTLTAASCAIRFGVVRGGTRKR